MAARRLILLMLVLLFLSSLTAALVPVRDPGSTSTSSTTTTKSAKAALPTDGALVRRTVAAGGKPETVRLRVGDHLQLTVTGRRPATLELPGFGLDSNVDPRPATFDLLAWQPGCFPLLALDARKPVARIDVAARGAKQPRCG